MQSAVSTIPREQALPLSTSGPPDSNEVGGAIRLTESTELLPPLSDAQALLQQFALTRDPDLRARLVLMHGRIVRYLASRFDSRSVPQEDLIQVAYIGLISALDRFDPSRGVSFITYAIPTILGEIKRYFRDQTWALKAPRRLRELGLTIRRVRRDLEQQLGRAPTIQEMAEVVDVPEERLLQAMEVDRCYKPCSLDSQFIGAEGCTGIVSDCIGEEDPYIAEVEQRGALAQVIACLERRQRQIIQLRFFEELSQAEVAQHLGISQMHVSRLERQALGQLREMLMAPA